MIREAWSGGGGGRIGARRKNRRGEVNGRRKGARGEGKR